MHRRLISVISVALALFVLAPAASARPSARANGGLLADIPVTGTLSDGGSFEGVLSVTGVSFEDGQLSVQGVLNGTATDADGIVTTIVDQVFDVVADLSGNAVGAACDILFLELEPIFLVLLGLQVDLSQITLDIDAVPGQGNLLGNLLCSVAGLLDGGLSGALQNLVDLIDGILGN